VTDLRSLILAADDRGTADLVEVPEWGTTVALRSPTVAQRTEGLSRILGPDGEADNLAMQVVTVILCLHDPTTNERVFSLADIDALAEKSAGVISRLFLRCQPLLGFGDTAQEEAKGNS